VKKTTGDTKITYHADGLEGEAWEEDFTPPFKKLDLMKGLEAELHVKLPDPATLHTPGNSTTVVAVVIVVVVVVVVVILTVPQL